MTDKTVSVIEKIDHTVWARERALFGKAGEIGPYGLEHLAKLGYQLNISDAYYRKPWSTRAFRSVEGRLERNPSNQGVAAALANLQLVASSDVLITMFENEGMFPAKLKRYAVPPYRRTPHVAVVCWLAESLYGLAPRRRAAVAGALRSVEAVVVFSQNQVEILCSELRLDSERIHVVDFGVDTSYFRRADGSPESNRVGNAVTLAAIGHDSARDYATLFNAVRRTNYQLTVVCAPRNLVSLNCEIPANVKILSGIPHHQYRQILWDSDIVITPTNAPNYPSGQTVMLEAMAAGCCTINTASHALERYVSSGQDCLTYTAGMSDELRQSIDLLASQPDLRASLSLKARFRVEKHFNHETMWQQLASIIDDVSQITQVSDHRDGSA